MAIELYVFPPSPRAFKVMANANHLGIDTTLHIVDLVKGDQKTPEYAALNPNMRIPTLKDVFKHVVKSVVLKNGEPDAAAIAKGAESFHRAAKVLDAQLKGKKFVTGDTLTLADFSLGAPMNLADMARLPIEPYAEIRRWCETLRALPAWQKTLVQCAIPAAVAA